MPVIASDFPYWRELLEPIGCATYVNPLEPDAIAAAIDELLADEERALDMGRRGAAAVRESLNWQQEEPKLLDLYERFGSRRRRSPCAGSSASPARRPVSSMHRSSDGCSPSCTTAAPTTGVG